MYTHRYKAYVYCFDVLLLCGLVNYGEAWETNVSTSMKAIWVTTYRHAKPDFANAPACAALLMEFVGMEAKDNGKFG